MRPLTRPPLALGGVQHLAALGGEVVDHLLHLALVLAPVAHLTLDQLLTGAAADDVGDPVAKPSGQNLDGEARVLSTLRDRVWAFDSNGADRPRDGSALLVEVLQLDLRGGLIEDVFWEGLQERDGGVPPGEESRRARALRLPAGLLLLQIDLRGSLSS